jgi:tRNA threonylcarbamoyladenosine biosynthesis protein TsaE
MRKTAEPGVRLAQWVQPGWVIGLTGDLGAGQDPVRERPRPRTRNPLPCSIPTFSLVHEYHDGRLPLFHLDLYRLDSMAQILGAGLEDYFRRDGAR